MTRLIIMSVFLALGLQMQAQQANTEKKQPKAPRTIIKTQKKKIDSVNDSIYYERIRKDELDGMYIPRDLYDCFRILDEQMTATAKEKFMAFSDEEVDRRTHGTLGFWMEHKWSIAEGSRLTEYFRNMGVPHYNYMIGIIIQSYHRHLHKKDIKIKEQVLAFRKDWEKKQKAKAEDMLINDKGSEE